MTRSFGPGSLQAIRIDKPSSGCTRSERTVGSSGTSGWALNRTFGTSLNWIATSLARLITCRVYSWARAADSFCLAIMLRLRSWP